MGKRVYSIDRDSQGVRRWSADLDIRYNFTFQSIALQLLCDVSDTTSMCLSVFNSGERQPHDRDTKS